MMAFSFYDADPTFVGPNQHLLQSLSVSDAAKLIAAYRQEIIADELARLTGQEYLPDILMHLQHMEDVTVPNAAYIDLQPEIQWFMRPYLLDFMVQVHGALDLDPETFFLAVNLLDRYCSRCLVRRRFYQLAGCAALLIAAKYSDQKSRAPSVRELYSICDGLYEVEWFTNMEGHMLKTLEWTIGHPTVDFFVKLIRMGNGDGQEVEHVALYLCEIALYHRDLLSAKPSALATSSMALARMILDRSNESTDEWNIADKVIFSTLRQHINQPSLTLIHKYSSRLFSSASHKVTDFTFRQACYAASAPAWNDLNTYAPLQTPNSTGFQGYITPPITPGDVAIQPSTLKHSYPLPPHCSTVHGTNVATAHCEAHQHVNHTKQPYPYILPRSSLASGSNNSSVTNKQ